MIAQPTDGSMFAPRCDHTTGCITCSDEGVPMRVVSMDQDGIAWCVSVSNETGDGAWAEVMTGLIETVAVGDVLLVHAGTALLKLAGPAEHAPRESVS